MKLQFGSRRTRIAAMIAATALAGSLAACGGSDSTKGADGGSSKKVDSIAAMVPKSIADKGTLVVAVATYPPAAIEPEDGSEPTGWDIETTREIAAVLGLKAEFKVIPFDGVVAGLQAGRYDAATGEIYITDERTASVTFVANHESTDAVMVAADSSLEAADSMESLCGLTLAAELGSAEADLVHEVAQKCESTGGAAVTEKTFQAQAAVNLALSEGRVDAALSSASQVAYVVSQTGDKFRLVPIDWATQYKTGLALSRNADSDALAKAVQAATDHLIEDGTLQGILDEFNGGQGLLDKAEIIPAPAS